MIERKMGALAAQWRHASWDVACRGNVIAILSVIRARELHGCWWLQGLAMQTFRLMYPHIGSLVGLFRLCGHCSESSNPPDIICS